MKHLLGVKNTIELLTIAIVSLIAGLSGFIGATYALRRFNYYEVFVDFIDSLLVDEQNMAKVYGLGQILGRGVSQGVGLGKPSTKQGKIFGLPSEIVLPFIQQFLGKKATPEGESPFGKV